ncbi:hypothetical protein LSH36_5g04038 [Paralvinella palmiformis]|uniref:Uncharacterized protein n=1 Tax=Paralvinella palmiformis TaxID=53620 RepID=A0AAD9NIP2_9ANNE|nr:hypothetical protein LSH36_5g04038 [Paralvinella palmiformis]
MLWKVPLVALWSVLGTELLWAVLPT